MRLRNHNHTTLMLLFLAPLVLSLADFIAILLLIADKSDLAVEDGLLESAQVLLLISALMILLYRGRSLPSGSLQIYMIGLILFCISAILREVDIEKYSLPQAIIFIGSGFGKKVMLALCWLSFFIFCSSRARSLVLSAPLFMKTSAGIVLVISGMFLLVGGVFDRQYLEVANAQFYEELMEFNAYLMLVLATMLIDTRQTIPYGLRVSEMGSSPSNIHY
ncbi:MAG TPA: hypothetical protein DCZ03_03535 [Gammaproteobacteria bacterium]|nr:hypothetical protein [Gammaproteobacteria bacterium]